MGRDPKRPRVSGGVSYLGLLGSAVILATTALYIALIVSEGNNSFGEVAPWAMTFAAVGVAAAWASFLRPSAVKGVLFALLAAIAFALGVIGLFSIGVFFVASGIFLTAAAATARGRRA